MWTCQVFCFKVLVRDKKINDKKIHNFLYETDVWINNVLLIFFLDEILALLEIERFENWIQYRIQRQIYRTESKPTVNPESDPKSNLGPDPEPDTGPVFKSLYVFKIEIRTNRRSSALKVR